MIARSEDQDVTSKGTGVAVGQLRTDKVRGPACLSIILQSQEVGVIAGGGSHSLGAGFYSCRSFNSQT